MDLRAAHRLLRPLGLAGALRPVFVACLIASLAAISAAFAACGTPDGAVRIAGVDDRLDLVLADGRTVRLGGLALPDPARAPDLADEARAFLAGFVGDDGALVRLAGGTDRWGRVVGDLALAGASGDVGESAAAALLAAGYARVAPAFEARGCAAARLRIEAEARGARLGVWADPATAVIASADRDRLRRSAGRLVVIEGRVRRVGAGRSRLYLDLVPKGGPTIVVPRKLEQAFASAGHPVDAAAGQTIRVRGALDNRLGPRLEVSEPEMMEFLGRTDAPGESRPRP